MPVSKAVYNANRSNASEVDFDAERRYDVYIENAGSPIGVVTPEFIGQYVYDTTNKDFYIATNTTSADWAASAFPDLSPEELNYLDIAELGTGEASKAVVIDANLEYKSPAGGHIETGRGRFEVFDDFGQQAIQLTGVGDGLWIGFAGSDGDATLAVTVAGVPEGQILIGSGSADDANSGSVLSQILLSQGSLVSLGMTVFECRVSLSALAGTEWNFGLSDTLCTDAERIIHYVDSGVVSDGGLACDNALTWAFSSDATAATKWQFTSENATAIVAAEAASANGPTADTYAVLRIEVDADGTARWYLNGTLEKTLALAVATTALLIPFIGGDSGTDAQAAVDTSVDYIYFSGARPSSNA